MPSPCYQFLVYISFARQKASPTFLTSHAALRVCSSLPFRHLMSHGDCNRYIFRRLSCRGFGTAPFEDAVNMDYTWGRLPCESLGFSFGREAYELEAYRQQASRRENSQGDRTQPTSRDERLRHQLSGDIGGFAAPGQDDENQSHHPPTNSPHNSTCSMHQTFIPAIPRADLTSEPSCLCMPLTMVIPFSRWRARRRSAKELKARHEEIMKEHQRLQEIEKRYQAELPHYEELHKHSPRVLSERFEHAQTKDIRPERVDPQRSVDMK